MRSLAALAVLTALGGSVATPPEGLEAECVRFESLGALEALADGGAPLGGKIAFVDQRLERARDGKAYGRAVGARTRGPVAAARAGASGVLIRSIGTSTNRLPHTGMTAYEPGVAKIPAAALSNPDADLMARLFATGKPVRVRFRLRGGARGGARAPRRGDRSGHRNGAPAGVLLECGRGRGAAPARGGACAGDHRRDRAPRRRPRRRGHRTDARGRGAALRPLPGRV